MNKGFEGLYSLIKGNSDLENVSLNLDTQCVQMPHHQPPIKAGGLPRRT